MVSNAQRAKSARQLEQEATMRRILEDAFKPNLPEKGLP
jgi:hypothetical protein